jgi:V8-like Glu-specific endopeptidase
MPERLRFERELSDLNLREVFDPDTRARVSISETLDVPYRWICRLTIPDTDPNESGYGAGTGVLVGPRHVLTAAHILVSLEDPGKTVGHRLLVQPARNGHDKPFDVVAVQGWQVNPEWVTKHRNKWRLRPQHDYALITLKKDVSIWKDDRLGDCPLSYWGASDRCGAGSEVGLTPDNVTGQEAIVTGYPGEKPAGTLWMGRGPITYDRRLGMLLHKVDTKPGQSGAPVWLMRNGIACLVGIHGGASGRWSSSTNGTLTLTDNAAVLLTPEVLRRIESWKRTFTR